MEIKTVKDIKLAADEMHDSEFNEEDLDFNFEKKIFCLRSWSSSDHSKKFCLRFYNVEQYDPINLDKIKKKKATAGVFDSIKIRDKGLALEILSQDLRILLKLNKLDGRFENK